MMSDEATAKAHLNENSFGVQDTMSHGLLNVKNKLSAGHPLEMQERNHHNTEQQNLMSQLKMTQGLYAPFKLSMERQFATKVGRLPCLKSSNLMLSVLNGTDDTLEVEDIFNNQKYFCEHNIDPHALFAANKLTL